MWKKGKLHLVNYEILQQLGDLHVLLCTYPCKVGFVVLILQKTMPTFTEPSPPTRLSCKPSTVHFHNNPITGV